MGEWQTKRPSRMSIESYKLVFTLYTDGSASNGIFNGGAAMVITSGPAHSPGREEESPCHPYFRKRMRPRLWRCSRSSPVSQRVEY